MKGRHKLFILIKDKNVSFHRGGGAPASQLGPSTGRSWQTVSGSAGATAREDDGGASPSPGRFQARFAAPARPARPSEPILMSSICDDKGTSVGYSNDVMQGKWMYGFPMFEKCPNCCHSLSALNEAKVILTVFNALV